MRGETVYAAKARIVCLTALVPPRAILMVFGGVWIAYVGSLVLVILSF